MTNEDAVTRLVESLPDPDLTLVTLALTLAQRVDAGVEDKSLPSMARELRATLEALRANGRPADPLDEFFAGLSAPVLDASRPQ